MDFSFDVYTITSHACISKNFIEELKVLLERPFLSSNFVAKIA